jgi:hypothetical protein
MYLIPDDIILHRINVNSQDDIDLAILKKAAFDGIGEVVTMMIIKKHIHPGFGLIGALDGEHIDLANDIMQMIQTGMTAYINVGNWINMILAKGCLYKNYVAMTWALEQGADYCPSCRFDINTHIKIHAPFLDRKLMRPYISREMYKSIGLCLITIFAIVTFRRLIFDVQNREL